MKEQVTIRSGMLSGLGGFHRIVREERLFCAVLAHLLMQRGHNLEAFIALINNKLPAEHRLQAESLSESQVYVEFTFLRDYWDSLGTDSHRKRLLISELLGRVDGLSHYNTGSFPDDASDFNEYFAGRWGKRIRGDIVYPGRWSVAVLADRFREQPAEFRDFCRFKWSFNIKPDVVVLIPGMKPLCVEAKLSSAEGQYPTSSRDKKVFDEIFGPEQGRVNQVELQGFMFERLLGTPCQLITLGLESKHEVESVAVSWGEAFEALELDHSLSYVRNLIEQNIHLT